MEEEEKREGRGTLRGMKGKESKDVKKERKSRIGTLRRRKKVKDESFDEQKNETISHQGKENPIDLETLATLLDSSDSEKQFEGLSRMEDLVDLPPLQFEPFIAKIVHLLNNGTSIVQVCALKSLRKILGNSDLLKEEFKKQNGLDIVLKLLSESTDKELLETIGSSLGYIISPETLESFCDAGAVPILLTHIEKSNSEKMKGFLFATLSTLTNTSAKARNETVSANGIPMLFTIIKNNDDEFLQEQAMGIVKNVMIDSPENQEAVRNAKGFELFKNILKVSNPTLLTETCAVIGVVISNEENRNKMNKLDLFEDMIDLLTKTKAITVKAGVAHVIAKLLDKNSSKQAKVCERVDQFIVLLKGNPVAQEAGATALNAAIIDNDAGRQQLLKKGVLPTAVSALSSTNEKTQEQVSSLVLNLLRDKFDTKVPTMQHPGITALGALLQSSPMCKMNAMKCFQILGTDNPKQQTIIREAGNIEKLVPLLESKDHNMCIQAAMTIEALTENNPKVQVTLGNAGVLPALISMLDSSNILLREKFSCALAALASNNPKNQQSIRQAGGIAYLVNTMNTVEESSSKEIAARTFAACVYRNSNCQASVKREGGIRTLIRLLSMDDQPRVQEEATNAVIASCVDNKENQDAMRNEGGLDYLVPLLCTRIISLQLAATKCIATLCAHNLENQDTFLQESTGTVDSLQDIVWTPNKPLRDEVKATLLLLGQTPIPRPMSSARPTRRNTVSLNKPIEPEPQETKNEELILEDPFDPQVNAEKARKLAKKNKKKTSFGFRSDDNFFSIVDNPFQSDRYGYHYGNMSR